MNITGLWNKLEPRQSTLETLKKDLKEGKVPELPYFVVDQTAVKAALNMKLASIDQNRMQTNLIIGDYGNGKTNLFKYLKLFFELSDNNVTVVYSRCDVEQPDVILFVLKLLEDHFTDNLVQGVVALKKQAADLNELANNFEDNFGAIREYANKLFSDGLTPEDLKRLIYLGTGRLYTKGQFAAFELPQLQNFNRREILVFFLNILATLEQYIIFEIDEVEKIQEKSKLRFNQFLTSYRELIDLFNKIKGHVIMTGFTYAKGETELEEANPALYTRIKPDILNLPPISAAEDILELAQCLDELFVTNRNDLDKIATQVSKKKHQRNRELIRHLTELLFEDVEIPSLEELLVRYELNILYDLTYQELQSESMFKSLHQKFFDPLEYYLEDNFLLQENSTLDRRANQAFIDQVHNTIHYFIFNDSSDIEGINKKVNNLLDKYKKDLVIYAPNNLELSNSQIVLEHSGFNFSIVDYDPEKLFVLLNMYRDNFELHETIGKTITAYTENNL
jgi:hypothetical protein